MLPESTDYWDGNWLHAPVEIAVGGIHAYKQAGLRADDLRRFREQLQKVYKALDSQARLDWI
jgi:hypothetical protein